MESIRQPQWCRKTESLPSAASTDRKSDRAQWRRRQLDPFRAIAHSPDLRLSSRSNYRYPPSPVPSSLQPLVAAIATTNATKNRCRMGFVVFLMQFPSDRRPAHVSRARRYDYRPRLLT